ncbi:MAG TPA: dynamin family protein [Desulfohalobiaceae bacterium]|nr:dynamin family protein [Desulfohalobiaceae bacterium]
MLNRSLVKDAPSQPVCDNDWWQTIRFPGLTKAIEEIQTLGQEIPKRCAVQKHKQQQNYLWIVFLGGTGTGKSTLFNALCGEELSQSSLERPKTGGPLAFVHKKTSIDEHLPFFTATPDHIPLNLFSQPQSGTPGKFILIEHEIEAFEHLVIVDTPDLDSLNVQNREMTEALYLLSDVVLFVTSQEKYADQVPFEFLIRINHDYKDCFFLFNKAETSPYNTNQDPDLKEVFATLNQHGLQFQNGHCLIMPAVQDNPLYYISNHPLFHHFSQNFLNQFSKKKTPNILKKELDRLQSNIQGQAAKLYSLLSEEEESAKIWGQELDKILESTWQNLLSKQEETFRTSSRKHIQSEIKRLFSRYDLLGKPRRFIASCITLPVRAMTGRLHREKQRSSDWRGNEAAYLNPVLESIDEFNRQVLENLMPIHDSSPLGRQLQESSFALTYNEVQEMVLSRQKELGEWLKQQFKELSRDLPLKKKWGIYSTSLVWGVMLLSLEVVIGGGITMIEAVLDSVLAPFMTKGSVDIFAYREIQRLAREMSQKYQNGLYAILQQQKNRYLKVVNETRTTQETFSSLYSLSKTGKPGHNI